MTIMKTTKKKKPKFNVLNYGFMKSVKASWRKPRGVDNKKRIRRAWAGASPRVGYRNPAAIRHLHPSGKHEILIHNLNELQYASGKLVRLASQLGARKRAAIEAKAKEMGLEMINARRSHEPGAMSREHNVAVSHGQGAVSNGRTGLRAQRPQLKASSTSSKPKAQGSKQV